MARDNSAAAGPPHHAIRAREARGGAAAPDFVTDPDRVGAYLQDAAHVPGGHAAAVVFPRDEAEVAAAVRAADRVLAVGAQSSLTGGATPRGGVVLSMAGLRRLTIGAGVMTAGAGVTMSELNDALRPRHASYPPFPTWTGATVGGTIATNAAGAATFKYGATRGWVEALTVVLASGEVLDLERGRTVAHPDGHFDLELASGTVRVPVPTYRLPAVPKVSAGYFAAPGMDLIDLFIGAEGTLGVVTEARLRTVDCCPARCLMFLTTEDPHVALSLAGALRLEAIDTWRGSGGALDVAAIEHMDGRSLALLREDGVDRRLGIRLDEAARIGLLVTVELADDDADRALERFMSILHEHGLEDAIVAEAGDDAAAERLLALREAVPVAVNQRIARAQREIDPRIEKTAADVIVPFSRFAEMLDCYERETRRRHLDLAVWGHISDGNVHPNVLPRSFADVEAGREAVLAFGREAIRLGGSPLAEHGVGRSAIKQQLMRELYGPEGVQQMKAIKQALDPEWKLAPGVLLTGP